jgi:sigma-B regulation protein RsbU (phosphoserine phosphatase)
MSELPSPPNAEEFFDLAPSGFLVLSETGLILKANKTFCAWIGAAGPEELVERKTLQEFFTMGGRIFHQTHWLPMLEMQGSLSEVKLDLRDSKGLKFPVLLNAVRHRTHDGSYDLITVVGAKERNQYERELLAARKRADDLLSKERIAQSTLRTTQTRLQQAMHLQAIYFWDVDPTTGQRRFAEEVALLLGATEPAAVDPAAFFNAMDPDERDADQRALARALEFLEPYRATYRLTAPDGAQRVVIASGQGFADDDGKLAEFVGTLVDVTESHRLRESAEDRALFAEQMVGIASHDLRNPLQSISLSAQVMFRDTDRNSQKSARMLSNIDNAARRAQRLISDLLDFTAARVGRGLSVQRQSIDLHHVVARTVEELAIAFPDAQLEHRRTGSGIVAADADRIAQIIGNLVGNAVSYGRKGSPVTITSAVLDDSAMVSVRNYGDPIPVDQQTRIFEPMVRGVALDSPMRNVGLGLFIVRAIAKAHDGSVNVLSSSEAGTTFEFRFGYRNGDAHP